MTEEQKQQFLSLYEQGWETRAACKEIGCSDNCGYKLLKRMHLKSNPPQPRKISLQQIEEIKKIYLQGKTIEELSEQFKIKQGTINYWLRKEKVTRPNGKVSDCDANYFEKIDTNKKAYFLGLLYADGGLLVEKNKNTEKITLSLELKNEDRYIVEEFKKELKSNLPIKDMIVENRPWLSNGKLYITNKHNAAFRVTCKKLIQDLEKWGCVKNKTQADLVIPNIPSEFKRSFLLGFFDGDGIASVGKRGHYMGFCGRLSLMKSIEEFLRKELSLSLHTIYYNKSNHIYYLQYTRTEEEKKLFEFLYSGEDVPLHLKRKEEKMFNVLYANTEVNL